MARGHHSHWTGDIVRAWVTHDGVCHVMIKDQGGQHHPTPILSDGILPDDLEGRRVKRIDGRWVLADQSGRAS